MKTLITNYSFNHTAKTIAFNDLNFIEQERLLLITNTTSNIIIYNFASATKGGTIVGNVLTLTYNTSSMNDSDQLQIYYDKGQTAEEYVESRTHDVYEEDMRELLPDLNDSLRLTLNNEDGTMTMEKLLLLAMDKGANMPLNVSLPTNFKTDSTGALVLADMAGPYRFISQNATSPLTIDCAGYSTIIVQKTTAGIITPTISNDQSNWLGTIAMNVTSTTAVAETIPTAVGIYLIPVVARYLMLTGPASSVDCTIYLSQAPFNQMTAMLNPPMNTSQFGGTPVVTGGVAGLQGVGGNIAVGVAPTSNPLPLGGRDDPLKTGLGYNQPQLTRALVTDNEGRLQIGQKQNWENVQPHVDKTRNEGMALVEIMDCILLEMKINNYYLYNLPCKILSGQPFDNSDEPAVLRNDEAFIESDEGQ